MVEGQSDRLVARARKDDDFKLAGLPDVEQCALILSMVELSMVELSNVRCETIQTEARMTHLLL